MATANYGNISSLNGQFAGRLQALFAAAKQEGHSLAVGSALRTKAEQTALYNEAIRKYGSNKIPGHQVAAPGSSRHESGLASDLEGTTAAKAWAKANAARFGLHFGVRGEDWHIEPVEVWGGKPPNGFTPIDVKAAKASVQNPGAPVATKKQSRAERNNNPGNIEYGAFAKKMGATGTDGRFAIFPSLDVGIQAGMQLLKASGYQKGTVADAIYRWAPPSDGNNSQAYANTVAKKAGVSASTPMKSLNDTQLRSMFAAMAGVESGNPNLVSKAGSGSGEAARTGQGPYVSKPGAMAGEAARNGTASTLTPSTGGALGLSSLPIPAPYQSTYKPMLALPDLGMQQQPDSPIPQPSYGALAQTGALNALLRLGGQGQTGKVRVFLDPRTGQTVTRPVGG